MREDRPSEARDYLLPESIAVLHRDNPEYARLVKTNPRLAEREYSAAMTPKAKRHLDKTIRRQWTDTHSDEDLDDIVRIIEKVLHARSK